MAEKCTKCPLYKRAESVKVPGRTIGSADILIVGEAPGAEEDESNRVFIGRAGKKLNWLCEKAGIENMHRRTNAVRCFPHGTPTVGPINICREYLVAEIRKHKPKVIVAAGRIAMKSLLGLDGIKENRGFWNTYTDGKKSYPVIPTYHPASALRRWNEDEIIIHDLAEAKRVVKRGKVPKYKPCKIQVVGQDCSIDDFYHDLRTKKVISLDAEFTHMDHTRGRVVCFSFAGDEDLGYVVPFLHCGDELYWYRGVDHQRAIRAIEKLMWDKRISKVGQVAAKDFCYLRKMGIEVNGYAMDTALAHSVLNENLPHSLTFLTGWYKLPFGHYDIGMDWYKTSGSKDSTAENRMLECPDNQLWEYAGLDAVSTLIVSRKIAEGLVAADRWKVPFRSVKQKQFPRLVELSWNGMMFDNDRLVCLIDSGIKEIKKYDTKLKKITQREDFNSNSPAQVVEVLKAKNLLGVAPKKTKGGSISSDESVLKKLAKSSKFCDYILRYRKISKRVSTFYLPILENISPDGRYRADYNAHTPATHRWSAFIHQIPKAKGGIRSAIIAPDGYKICYSDFKQLELRFIALVAGDKLMLKEFKDGKDPMTNLTAEMYGVKVADVEEEARGKVKTVVYGAVYWRTAQAIVDDPKFEELNLEVEFVQEAMDSFFYRYDRIRSWMDWAYDFVLENGYIEIPGGFVRNFMPSIEWIRENSRAIKGYRNGDGMCDKDLAGMGRSGENAPIQGGASWMVSTRIFKFTDYLARKNISREDAQYVFYHHDAVVFYVKEMRVNWFMGQMRKQMEWKNFTFDKKHYVDFLLDQKVLDRLQPIPLEEAA